MIRRRSAIEPAIGHIKANGKLERNWLKGALGNAIHVVLCVAGHNQRMMLKKLRLFLRLNLGCFALAMLTCCRRHECAAEQSEFKTNCLGPPY